MRRRDLLALPLVPAAAAAAPGQAEPHFPDRLHQFIFRNWELANTDRMASVIGATPAQVLAAGRSMGLPPKPVLTPGQLRRIYITVIRQNWRLLPDSQIVDLLGWTPQKFDYTLREDDFLNVKLGAKPELESLRYEEPSPAARRRAADIRDILRRELGSALAEAGEPPFAFVERLSRPGGAAPLSAGEPAWDLRFLYSYFALYGDPLLEPDIDPFPDGYLERLAALGINGIWMQAVLRNLAPSRLFPEFGERAGERLAALRRLVERAARHGMRVFLYINEPRAMPPEFFRQRPGLRGARSRELYAMCTSPPPVRAWLADSLAHVFREVPGLGGVFSITMSENFTHCFSHLRPDSCPRCSRRQSWQVVGEVLEAIHTGVRRASRSAEVIVWDWGWPDLMARELIPRLPRDSRFQSVSEWSLPLDRGGVRTTVGEYSISAVGPGPRARAHWQMAGDAGVRTLAKTQFNNTWEISAVPYIPVPGLIARHCANLRQAGVSGVMASWTLGGYPSPNLEVAREFYFGPPSTPEAALERVARRRYGAAGPRVLEAWRAFGEAFEQFPYGVSLYIVPTQHGPANLLRAAPSGVPPSMILFPQDDYRRWAGQYPPAIARGQFAKTAALWERGLTVYRQALRNRPAAAEDLAIAETCWIHFRSVANQFDFYLDPARRRSVLEDEIRLAGRLFRLARRHSVLAYEASNHYYYRPLDLAEKILNCRQLLELLA